MGCLGGQALGAAGHRGDAGRLPGRGELLRGVCGERARGLAKVPGVCAGVIRAMRVFERNARAVEDITTVDR